MSIPSVVITGVVSDAGEEKPYIRYEISKMAVKQGKTNKTHPKQNVKEIYNNYKYIVMLQR